MTIKATADVRKQQSWEETNLFLYDNVIHYINGKKVLRASDKGDLSGKKNRNEYVGLW